MPLICQFFNAKAHGRVVLLIDELVLHDLPALLIQRGQKALQLRQLLRTARVAVVGHQRDAAAGHQPRLYLADGAKG